MNRQSLIALKQWKKALTRKPLIMRGVRQSGKTWLVRELGKEFRQLVEINFEKTPSFSEVFQRDLDPKRILRELSIRLNRPLEERETLFFFDEIQVCPQALLALRYFYEEMPHVAVIGAGSLLQLAIEKVGMPVGRVEFFYVYPMSFFEFLDATEKMMLREWIQNDPIFDSLYETFCIFPVFFEIFWENSVH